ncbi:MAG: Cellulophaga phage phi46:3 [Bacteroidota bacterium]|jgi:hypothetical protein
MNESIVQLRKLKEKEYPWKISPEVREIFAEEGITIKKKPKKPRVRKKRYRQVVENANYDILEHFHIVRHYFYKVKKIDLQLLEILLALYPKQYFTQSDYKFINKQYTYNRIKKLMDLGYIVLFSKDPNKMHGVYCLSIKAKHIVQDFYMCLSGEKKMSEDYTINPIFSKNQSTMDRKKAYIIKTLNKLTVPDSKKALFE